MKPIYLYIKTHNVTGMKYFGMTTAADPHRYRGSGIRWLNHINKYGNNVTTEIVGLFEDKEECAKVALKFSADNNIVQSDKWANIIPESLQGGAESGRLGFEARKRNLAASEEARQNYSKKISVAQKRRYANGGTSNFHSNNPMSNEISVCKRQVTLKEINHQQGERNSQFGSMWITNETENKKIKKIDPIPEGWRKGRTVLSPTR